MTQLVGPVKSTYRTQLPLERSLRQKILLNSCYNAPLLDKLIDQCNNGKNPNAMSELSIVFLQFPTKVLTRIRVLKGQSRKDWEVPLTTLAIENSPSLFHTIPLTRLLNIPNNFPTLIEGVAQEITSRLFSSDLNIRRRTTRTLIEIYGTALASPKPPMIVSLLNQAVKSYMNANGFEINKEIYRKMSLNFSSINNNYLDSVLRPFMFNPNEYK